MVNCLRETKNPRGNFSFLLSQMKLPIPMRTIIRIYFSFIFYFECVSFTIYNSYSESKTNIQTLDIPNELNKLFQVTIQNAFFAWIEFLKPFHFITWFIDIKHWLKRALSLKKWIEISFFNRILFIFQFVKDKRIWNGWKKVEC